MTRWRWCVRHAAGFTFCVPPLPPQGRGHPRLCVSCLQDGYRVARASEFMIDEVHGAGSEAAAELEAAAAGMSQQADAWLERLRGLAQTHRGLTDLMRRAGTKPEAGQHEALSWWVARLVCPLLDQVDHQVRARLMMTRSTLERLREEQQLLRRLNTNQTCSIM